MSTFDKKQELTTHEDSYSVSGAATNESHINDNAPHSFPFFQGLESDPVSLVLFAAVLFSFVLSLAYMGYIVVEIHSDEL